MRSSFVKRKVLGVFVFAFAVYFLFFTGPRDLDSYPSAATSPYRLPWKAGVSRFVSQGNYSFTTHRGFHEYSWDFWMPIGTEILASRAGRVIEVVQHLDGIGFFHGNRVIIEHEDGTRAVYAHIQKNGARATIGEVVQQGQLIALSGMVGATVNPHLHFHVLNPDGTHSIPITFQDVENDIPRAGRFYISKNVSP